MPGELVLRVLETGQERRVSSDVVSQGLLDSLEPGLAEALENGLPVSIRGEFGLRAKVDHGRLHARVWHGEEASAMPLMAMTVSRASGEGKPLLEVSLAGMHAAGVAGEFGRSAVSHRLVLAAEMRQLREGQERNRDGSRDGGKDRRRRFFRSGPGGAGLLLMRHPRRIRHEITPGAHTLQRMTCVRSGLRNQTVRKWTDDPSLLGQELLPSDPE